MVICPVCDAEIDVGEDEFEEEDTLTCDECGADLHVVSVDPLDLEPIEDDDDDEEAPDFEDEDEEDETWK
jgi:alpha-aminoadipate carrier protein LysW